MTATTDRYMHSESPGSAYGVGYSHSAYGLRLRSDLALPELPAASHGAPDITVRLGRIDLPAPQPREEDDGAAAVQPDGAFLYYYPGAGMFLVRGGREIMIDPAPGADEPLLRIYLLGPAMGLLLHQRGELALHASAVCIDGQAVAFLGESGEGKSTLAAFLHRRGHAIVTDDVLVIRPDSAGVPLAHPGFAQIKLWPESVEAFGDDPADLPQLHASFEKRFYRPERGFAGRPLPLRQIYVLAEDDALGVTPTRPHEALLELVINTYALRFVGSAGGSGAHFRQCAALASGVRIEYLRRPWSLDGLADAAELLERRMVREPDSKEALL